MTQRLFVYGTLSPGHEPAPLQPIVARMTPIGPASVAGSLYDLGVYPGALLDGSPGRIIGQVFDVPGDDSIWRALDAYEGFDPTRPEAGLFRRERCVARLDSGGEIECQIYVYNGEPPEALRVPHGRWKPVERSDSSVR